MKRYIFFCVVVFFASCSPYNVKTEIEKSSYLSKYKSCGIILRLSHNSVIKRSKYAKNLFYWLEGYNKLNKLILISKISEKSGVFSSEIERFYQFSPKREFLKYKSIGVIKYYLRYNEEELKQILSDNNLDSLIIYEIDSGFSTELQYIDFNSMIIIVDSEFNIGLLDYQKVGFDINEYDSEKVRGHLLDKISDRFLKKLLELKYIEEK